MMKVFNHTGGEWKCHYCDVELDPSADFGTPGQVTIDHLIPQKIGKYQGVWNTVLCCVRCNKRKGAMTYELFTGKSTLPEQCWGYFRTTDEAVFAARFKEARHLINAETGKSHSLITLSRAGLI